MSSLKYFRDEYVAHIAGAGCPFDPEASTLVARVPSGPEGGRS